MVVASADVCAGAVDTWQKSAIDKRHARVSPAPAGARQRLAKATIDEAGQTGGLKNARGGYSIEDIS